MPDTSLDTAKSALNTKIKTALEELRHLLQITPNKDAIKVANDKINKIILELQSLVANIQAPVTTVPTQPAEDGKVPEFWRKNRDFGEK